MNRRTFIQKFSVAAAGFLAAAGLAAAFLAAGFFFFFCPEVEELCGVVEDCTPLPGVARHQAFPIETEAANNRTAIRKVLGLSSNHCRRLRAVA